MSIKRISSKMRLLQLQLHLRIIFMVGVLFVGGLRSLS